MNGSARGRRSAETLRAPSDRRPPPHTTVARSLRLLVRNHAGRSVLILAVLLAGSCAPPQGDRSGTLVVALTSDPGHLNPAITTGGGVHTAADLLYDGLVDLDEEQRPIPALAERWEVEEGGARYRFHLRPGVTWHDGTPFTAADVKFTFDSILLRFHARTRASLGRALTAITTPDSLTVEFRFRHPYAPLLQQLNVVEAPIVPRHVYRGIDPLTAPANRAPVGTGPYRFEAYVPDAEIRYEANPDYFGGTPAVPRVVLRVIPDEGLQVVALEAGEVDWLFGVPGPDRARLQRNPAIGFLETGLNPGGSNCVTTLAFNLDRSLFHDVRVRRAIGHAIDRAQILERVLFGQGRVATAPITSGIPFAHAADVAVPAHDTAAANRLLDEAGWPRGPEGIRVAQGAFGLPDGTRLAIQFLHFPSFAAYADLLRAQLRLVGIDLVLVPSEPAVFVDAVFRARNFDMGIISYCQGTDPEIGARRMYVSEMIAPVPFSNAAGYRNPEMDSLWNAAQQTLDVETRRRTYRRIQEIAIHDMPYVWLVETRATRAYRLRCRGFTSAAHFAARARCNP